MKKLFTVFVIIATTIGIFAQSPQKMSYQAVIRRSTGQLVADHEVGMRISILQGTSTGTVVYQEIFNPNPRTNANGLVSIEIGGGIPITGSFSSINWASGSYFLKTETDPTGGTNYTVVGTSQLLSVPYALYAKNGYTHYIGELYGGGIIVAVGSMGGAEHGLIASLTDLGATSAWSNLSTSIGATAESPVDGPGNTTAIITQVGHTGSAALLCDAYSSGIYDDWYLPAAWELNLCYNVAYVVNSVLGAANGFQLETYWSSTEAAGGGTNAYALLFNTGYLNYLSKSNLYRVRAIRQF